jgi:hypothetical protein
MTELTPELAGRMLDRFGPPRRFVSPNETPTTPELLRLLGARLSSRVHWVARQVEMPDETVRGVLRSFCSARPSEPEELSDLRRPDSGWLGK